MSFGSWVVAVDVAPAATHQRVTRCLRDLVFEEILPCVFSDRWAPPRRDVLERRLARALRARGMLVGRIFWVAARMKAAG